MANIPHHRSYRRGRFCRARFWSGRFLVGLRHAHQGHRHPSSAVAAVPTKMQRGQSLSLSFERGMRRWLLSDGTSVADKVPKVVTADHRVLSVGDALFKNMPGQAWRYGEY